MNYGNQSKPGNIFQRTREELFRCPWPSIQQLIEAGVQIVRWGKKESSTYNKADYDYFAAWTFAGMDAVKQFEQMVEGAGGTIVLTR